MAYVPRPHVSAALQHLRFSVAVCAIVLGTCLMGQLLIWSFVHFTDVRVQKLESPDAPDRLTVVESTAAQDIAQPGAPDQPAEQTGDPAQQPPPKQTADPNTVVSTGDVLLRRVAGLVQTLGLISAVVFTLLLYQGVSVAGGGSVPGVEMAVTASTWGLIVSILALPIAEIIPGSVYPGVFQSYQNMVTDSAAYRDGAANAGPIGFYGVHVLLPLLMTAGLAAATLRFRAGIERGVIVTNVSQLDEKLEREIRSMKLGQLSTPRSVGALNHAIGDEGEDEEPEPPAPRKAAGAEHSAPPHLRPLSEPSPGAPERRPI